MRKFVFDTNVWISGLLWNGAPRKLIERTIQGSIQVAISPILLQELYDLLTRPKFGLGEITVHRYIKEVEDICVLVSPKIVDKVVIADPDDDHVIACAVEFDAEIIATGDEHLLALRGYLGVRCLSPAEVLTRLNS